MSVFAELLQQRAPAALLHSKVCVAKLESLWKDLGFDDESEQRQHVCDGMDAADEVWRKLVASWEAKRTQLQQDVDEMVAEVCSLQRQLGLEPTGATLPTLTVRAALERAKAEVATWRERRSQRQQEFEALQMSNSVIRTQLGIAPPAASKPDLTPAGFDFLHLEHERLLSDQERRLCQLEVEMRRLREISGEVLGEDVLRVAAGVHHTLRHYSFPEHVPTPGGAGGPAPSPTPAGSAVDLSTATLEGLDFKIKELHKVKAEREAKLQQLEDVLCSLWQAEGVPDDHPQRVALEAGRSNPHRLHAGHMDKMVSEVHRLEESRAQSMRELAIAKAEELRQVQQASHVTVQTLGEILNLKDLNRRASGETAETGVSNPISACLARVMRELSEAQQELERRRHVVTAVSRVQRDRQEAEWLREYEADANRLKGRNSNSNLQRSIKAKDLRAELPNRLARLQHTLESWLLQHGTPFLYDGEDFTEKLQVMRDEYQQEANLEREKLAQKQLTKHVQQKQGGPLTPVPAGHTPLAHRGMTPNGRTALLKPGASVQITPAALQRLSPAFANQSMQLSPGDMAGLTAVAPTPPRVPIRPGASATKPGVTSQPYSLRGSTQGKVDQRAGRRSDKPIPAATPLAGGLHTPQRSGTDPGAAAAMMSPTKAMARVTIEDRRADDHDSTFFDINEPAAPAAAVAPADTDLLHDQASVSDLSHLAVTPLRSRIPRPV